MRANKNELRIRNFISEIWNAPGGEDRASEFLAPDYEDHAYAGGLSGLKSAIRELRMAFSDAQFTIDDILAMEDRVAVRMTMKARHDGDFRGRAPTGRPVVVKVFRWYRLTEGNIAEHWALFDTAALLRQLAAES